MMKTSDMWSKVYLVVLAAAVIVMAFFTYYSWSWLQSIGTPSSAIAGFEYHSALAWTTLWFSTLILLLLGNIVAWTANREWAIWTTFLYFTIFVLLRMFWLSQVFMDFKGGFDSSDLRFSAGLFFALILIILMGVIVFLDQFAVVRLRRRIYPPEMPDVPKSEPRAE